MLKVDNVTFRTESRQILAPTSFAVEPEQAAVIVGPNGSGKSTLMRMISGLLSPSSGRIDVGAEATWVPQRGLVEAILRVSEYLAVACRSSKGLTLSDISTHLEGLGFDAKLMSLPLMSLSGGERRKVQLALALAHSTTNLFVFDEPTAPLDSESSAAFWKRIDDKLHHGAGVVYVSHNAEEIAKANTTVELSVRNSAKVEL